MGCDESGLRHSRNGMPQVMDPSGAPMGHELAPSAVEGRIGRGHTVIEPLGVRISLGSVIREGLGHEVLAVISAGPFGTEVNLQDAVSCVEAVVQDSKIADKASKGRVR